MLEANEHYWRKAPSVKRLVLKSISDDTTRAAMLKRGEADIAYTFRGAVAEDLQRAPALTLKPTLFNAAYWIMFTERVAEPSLGLITGFPWSAPYEELRLKGR